MPTSTPDRDGFAFIYEHGAAHDGYHEEPIERPGTGHCRRSDGTTGHLADLVPDGWIITDFSLDLHIHSEDLPVRVYLAYDPDRIVRTSKDHTGPVRRWRMVEGQLHPR